MSTTTRKGSPQPCVDVQGTYRVGDSNCSSRGVVPIPRLLARTQTGCSLDIAAATMRVPMLQHCSDQALPHSAAISKPAVAVSCYVLAR